MFRIHVICTLFVGASIFASGCTAKPFDADPERTGSTEQASSVHLKGGANAEPSFRDNGLTLRTNGALSGLGGGDVYVTCTATANPTATCKNHGVTENLPPGQNPAPVTVTGSVSIAEEEIKNGTTPFLVTTLAPATPIPGAPHCPNDNWTENITDMAFTSATITIEQPPGTTVLTISCSISPQTSNGAVSGSTVTCTSS
jgi:hypothetical protein